MKIYAVSIRWAHEPNPYDTLQIARYIDQRSPLIFIITGRYPVLLHIRPSADFGKLHSPTLPFARSFRRVIVLRQVS